MAATDRPECFAGLQTAPLKAPEESESALMVSECVRNPVRTLISAYLFQLAREALGLALETRKLGLGEEPPAQVNQSQSAEELKVYGWACPAGWARTEFEDVRGCPAFVVYPSSAPTCPACLQRSPEPHACPKTRVWLATRASSQPAALFRPGPPT